MESFPPKLSHNLIKPIVNNFPFNLYLTHKLKNKKLLAYFLRRLLKVDYKNLKVSFIGKGHTNGVFDIIQLPNSNILSCSLDTSLKLWSIDSLECIGTFTEHKCSVYSLLRVGEFVLSCDQDGFIFLWRWDEMKVLDTKIAYEGGEVYQLIEVKEGIVASGQSDFSASSIKLWSIENNKLKDLQVELIHGVGIRSLLSIDAGKKILSCGDWDGTIKVWDLETNECTHTLEGHNSSVDDLVLVTRKNENAGYADYVLSGSDDSTIKVWSVPDFKCIQTIKVDAGVERLCLLDHFTLASGDNLGNITIFDLSEITSVEKVSTVEAHEGRTRRIIKLSDGRIASCSAEKTIKIME